MKTQLGSQSVIQKLNFHINYGFGFVNFTLNGALDMEINGLKQYA